MKKIKLYIPVIMLSLLSFSCATFQDRDQEFVLSDGDYKLGVDGENLKLSFYDSRGILITPSDTISGLFINGSPVIKSELETKTLSEAVLNVTSAKDEKAKVHLVFEDGVTKITVAPAINNSKVSLRFGGMPVAYGLGDAGGWNNTFNLSGSEEKTFDIVNNGGKLRWASSFAIFPKNDFAGVVFDRGKKNVTLSENTYQLTTEIESTSTFYFFMGKPKSIYSNFKKVRNELGYEDIKPKPRLFELGWESWDALGWNTSQETVKNILTQFLEEDYHIRWAVTGSGFWEEGGTTTSFGRFGEKFSEAETFISWMHEQDIYWMIGLRTNMIPSGGPYYPKTDKRNGNLKVRSLDGNALSDDALENNLLLTNDKNQPRRITSSIFPIVPCFLIDGNKVGAASWFQKKYEKWGVDGIKEDTMMDLEEETSIFNKPISEISKKGGHVMACNGEFSTPGTLLRINDSKVSEIQRRIPINYFQYAASGAPNVYSDVCGVHNMHNLNEIDANIRHTWLLSLTSGMAFGAFPSKWSKEEQSIFKKAANFHYSLVPYLYSAAMKSYETGFPYTLTPLSIAYAEDEKAVKAENFQWMIGESILATPLLKNYMDGKMDIYLPEGTWYDWDTGEKFNGPMLLELFEIPLQKVPCFVGGDGVVILRNHRTDSFVARIYRMNKKADAQFYSLKDDEKYHVKVSTSNFDNVAVFNSATGKSIKFEVHEAYIEFPIVEGKDYEVR